MNSIYTILFLTWMANPVNADHKDDFHTCEFDAHMWKVITKICIDFIHGDIHSRSYKKYIQYKMMYMVSSKYTCTWISAVNNYGQVNGIY